MPTTRPRHQVTETDELAHAIDLAAQRWPNEPRSKLLLRVVALGSAQLEEELSSTLMNRLAAIVETSGKYADAFSPGYLEELRQDWPA